MKTSGRRSFVFCCIVAYSWLGLIGCRAPQPVSSTTNKTVERDSSKTVKTEKKDSSSYTEKLTPKVLPGSSALAAATIDRLDSLAKLLQSMPRGTDTIYLTDPKRDVALRAYFDKHTKQLMLECQSRDKIYFEKESRYERIISNLRDSVATFSKKEAQTTTQVVEQRKGFWYKVWEETKTMIIFLIAIFVIGTLAGFKLPRRS